MHDLYKLAEYCYFQAKLYSKAPYFFNDQFLLFQQRGKISIYHLRRIVNVDHSWAVKLDQSIQARP